MELGCKAACTGAGTVNMRVGLGLTFYFKEVIKKKTHRQIYVFFGGLQLLSLLFNMLLHFFINKSCISLLISHVLIGLSNVSKYHVYSELHNIIRCLVNLQ